MRAKGIPNKRTKAIDDLIDSSKLGPAEALMAILNRDHKKLGREEATVSRWTSAGIEYLEEVITMNHQLDAAKTLMKYRYSQKQAMDITSSDGSGIKIVIEDYSQKK